MAKNTQRLRLIALLLIVVAFGFIFGLCTMHASVSNNQGNDLEQQEPVESEIVVEFVTRGTDGLRYSSTCTGYFPGGYYVIKAVSTQVPDYSWFQGDFTHFQVEFAKEEAAGLLVIDVVVDDVVKSTVETDEEYGSISFEHHFHSAPTKL